MTNTLRKYRFYVIMGLLNIASVFALVQAGGPTTASVPASIPIKSTYQSPEAIYDKPVLLRVPSLGIELKVEEGHYNPSDGSWNISGFDSHFAMPSMLANENGGNTIIYGHNNKHVFGPLKGLSSGAMAEVITKQGHKFYYAFQSSETIPPNDVSAFYYEGAPILTLQTCTGNWHEQRLMSVFKLTKAVRYNPTAETDAKNTELLKASLGDLVATGENNPILTD